MGEVIGSPRRASWCILVVPMTDGRNFLDWLEQAQPPRPGFRRTRRPSQIPNVLSVGALRVVYQPIVDLRRNRIYAYEALVRSDSPHFQGPPALFNEAIRSQVCGALGRVVRELATSSCPDYPLFLNVHPNEFDEGWLVQPDDPIFSHDHPVYLEITESVPLSHFALCHSVLREIRSKGVSLAVDDLGAGYSNLKYIVDLQPEVVKLDRGLVAQAHRDERMQVLLRHIVRLCEELGARVVAEGIETREELDVVRAAGAHYGQGYFLARPSFPPPGIAA
jgi:EAL domain-containing protein (putative c-di-GMP-specific phosphodiesterase class I)